MDVWGLLPIIGWAITTIGLAISVYTAATGKWVPLPARLVSKSIPTTERARRLSGLGTGALFVALAIEQSFASRHLSPPLRFLVFLAVFALLIASVLLLLKVSRTTR
jgi:hypothetical protein